MGWVYDLEEGDEKCEQTLVGNLLGNVHVKD
jgi:hypothetical protein